MGLDMYLNGHKYLTGGSHEKPEVTEDGFRLKEKVLELGYWRKEPDLHGYIVNTFAGGKDECQEISLTVEDLEQIRTAVIERQLPHTTGFFFGKSSDINNPQEREWALQFERETVEILTKAIEWLKDEKQEENVWRTVYYLASW